MSTTERTIAIGTPDLRSIVIHIQGKTPLICSNGAQAITELNAAEAKVKTPKTKRPPRDREAAFRASLYEMTADTFGFPGSGIKRAVKDAGMRFTDEKGTVLAGALQITADLVEIQGSEPYMREDYVRHGGRTPDLAFRACFENWEMHVPVTYNAEVIGEAQVLTLFSIAGFAIGLGAWRPEKNGTFGQFEVVGAQAKD